MGSTIQNIHRQFSDPRMKPDRVGPTAGATAMTIEMVPMVCPRRSAGIEFHDRRHQQRHHDGSAARLHDPSGEQHGEARRQRRDQRADAEQ